MPVHGLDIGSGEGAVGSSKVRVQRHCLLQGGDGSFSIGPAKSLPAAQELIVGIDVVGRLLPDLFDFRRRELGLQSARDDLTDGALDLEDVLQVAVVGVSPEVLAFPDDWTAAFDEQSADRLTGYWVEGNVSSVSFADRIMGLEEIAAFYQNLLSDRVATEMEWLPGSVVDVISPTAALFQGTVRSVVTPSEGDSYTQQVHFTHFLKKIDGSWKIQRNHVSGGAVTEG